MNAYCSLLATDNYLKCAYGLYYSYKQINSKYPLIVLATDNLSNSTFLILDNLSIPYLKIPYKEFQNGAQFKCTINKFYAWNLIEFEKILFLDIDTIFVSNIDNYFETMTIHNNYGPMFLLQPNKCICEELFNLSYLSDYVTDEQVMSEYFQIKENICHFPQNQIHHFAWQPKYIYYYTTYESINNMIQTVQLNKNLSSLHDFVKWQKEQQNKK